MLVIFIYFVKPYLFMLCKKLLKKCKTFNFSVFKTNINQTPTYIFLRKFLPFKASKFSEFSSTSLCDFDFRCLFKKCFQWKGKVKRQVAHSYETLSISGTFLPRARLLPSLSHNTHLKRPDPKLYTMFFFYNKNSSA